MTSEAEAGVDMAIPKIGLNPDDVELAVLLTDCVEAVGAVSALVVGAEEVNPKRLPPPRLSVLDEVGRG